MGWRHRHRQCRLVGFLIRARQLGPSQCQTLTWDQGPEAVGLRAALHLSLLSCHRLLGTILVDRAELEEVAPVRLEAQEVVQDSRAVTDQVTLTMLVGWSLLMARTPLSHWRLRGFTGTGHSPQCSCIGNDCRTTRSSASELPSG